MAESTPTNVAGEWQVEVEFLQGGSTHAMALEQDGETVSGRYRFGFSSGDVQGTVRGDEIELHTSFRHEASGVSYHYTGKAEGDTMRGAVDLGEYWTARWTAIRA